MAKYYHYAAKIHDSLRAGTPEENPLYMGTKKGIVIDGVEALDWMGTPGTISSSIDPTESRCSVSSTKLKVMNTNYTISQWLYKRTNDDNTMTYGEKVELWAIKADNSKELIYTGIIRGINNDPTSTYYEFEVTDFQQRLKTAIFEREFSKYGSETVSQINSYRLPGDSSNGFHMIERDEGETDEDGGSILTKVIEFRGHVIDFVEKIYEVAFSTDNLDIGVPYLTDQWDDFVDRTTLDSVRATLSAALYDFYFEFREPISDPYDFLNTNIYQPCAIFPYVNLEGKLGLKLHAQPTVGTVGITINEDNILRVNSNNMTDENIINHIKVSYGWDFKENEGKTARLFGNTASFNKFKMLIPQDSPEEYEVRGINNLSPTDRATFSQILTDAMFARYALPNQKIKATVPLEVGNQWRLGSYLFVSHKKIVAWEGETQGLPGVGNTGEEEPQDPYEGLAYFNVGHEWGAFIEGNNLGRAIDGVVVINTQSKEITADVFKSTINGCKNNHVKGSDWLIEQGV